MTLSSSTTKPHQVLTADKKRVQTPGSSSSKCSSVFFPNSARPWTPTSKNVGFDGTLPHFQKNNKKKFQHVQSKINSGRGGDNLTLQDGKVKDTKTKDGVKSQSRECKDPGSPAYGKNPRIQQSTSMDSVINKKLEPIITVRKSTSSPMVQPKGQVVVLTSTSDLQSVTQNKQLDSNSNLQQNIRSPRSFQGKRISVDPEIIRRLVILATKAKKARIRASAGNSNARSDLNKCTHGSTMKAHGSNSNQSIGSVGSSSAGSNNLRKTACRNVKKKRKVKKVPNSEAFIRDQSRQVDHQLNHVLELQLELESEVRALMESLESSTHDSSDSGCSEGSTGSPSESQQNILKSLLAKQKRIIKLQIDLRKRYGMSSFLRPFGSCSAPEDEIILNGFNAHASTLAPHIQRINGTLAYYCSTCGFIAKKELKFRDHLESIDHVLRAYVAISDLDLEAGLGLPWNESCSNQCGLTKMNGKGTTRYMRQIIINDKSKMDKGSQFGPRTSSKIKMRSSHSSISKSNSTRLNLSLSTEESESSI